MAMAIFRTGNQPLSVEFIPVINFLRMTNTKHNVKAEHYLLQQQLMRKKKWRENQKISLNKLVFPLSNV